jgi:hypothetical protein
MTSSLEELLTRSAALGGRLSVGEALEINQAILEIDPENEIAATRLGIGLLSADRVQDAVPVLEAAVLAHPGNAFASRRLEQARRDLVRPPVPERKRRGAAPPRGVWVKAMPHPDGWSVKPGELSWVNDAGIIDKEGHRVFREDGQAAGKPSWRVGDPVGLYSGETKRVSVLGEVAQAPAFDPVFVAVNSGSAKDGQRWPWVTMIRVLHCAPTDIGPTLEELAIAGRGMQLRTRKLLDDAQAKVLLGTLTAI